MIQTAHKIELVANNKQVTYFRQACGVARLAWNWGLNQWNEQYKKGDKPSGFGLKKEFNTIKKMKYPFVFNVTKYACQQPFLQLQKAWKDFFKGQSQRPRFKKKGRCKNSFYIGGDQIKVNGKYVKIPKLGLVKMREHLRFEGKINGVTISRTANKWFIAFNVEIPFDNVLSENQAKTGIDLGIKYFAIFDNGVVIDSPKPLKKKLQRLKRLSRKLSKKEKGSKNFEKQKLKIARLHAEIANIRKDFLHKVSSCITANFEHIAMENLNVSGMVKNRRLSRAISDLGWHEFKRQLEYKSARKNNELIFCDRWFASSKICHVCGSKKEELPLSKRIYECNSCGLILDRDINAAKNIAKQISGAYREFTPVEMTALLKESGILLATSIVETGI